MLRAVLRVKPHGNDRPAGWPERALAALGADWGWDAKRAHAPAVYDLLVRDGYGGVESCSLAAAHGILVLGVKQGGMRASRHAQVSVGHRATVTMRI